MNASTKNPPSLPFVWAFDRGTETLVYIDAERGEIQKYERKVWESMTAKNSRGETVKLYSLEGMRSLPDASIILRNLGAQQGGQHAQ